MPASSASAGMNTLHVAECGDPEVAAGSYLADGSISIFANLKTLGSSASITVSAHQHTFKPISMSSSFRFNRRFYAAFNAFRSLLGIAGDVSAPTFDELYSGTCWLHRNKVHKRSEECCCYYFIECA